MTLRINSATTIKSSTTVGFQPGSLFAAGEQGVWYDPSDLTTMFSDAAGTTPVGAPGNGSQQLVGRINDKSGRGNNATQSTAGNRPELSARVNVLTYTEDFTPGTVVAGRPWDVGVNNGVISADATTAPNNTSTADLLYPGSSGTFRSVYQAVSGLTSSNYTASVYAKVAGINFLYFVDYAGGGGIAWFDLSSGTKGTVGSGYTSDMVSAGNGWYRCSIRNNSATSPAYFQIGVSNADNSSSVTASGTNGVYIWGADLRATNDGVGLPVYQRVNTSTDYDTTGFPYYLAFNGTTNNRFMVTGNISFTSTDKVTSWSGVRKNENSNGMVVELSAAAGTGNPGSFALIAPSLSGDDFYWRSAGTAQSNANYVVASPTTQVACGIGDISGDISTLRLNGTQVATSSTDQGTGNYGNYPIYIGSRGGTSVYLTGRIYSIVVRGAASTSTQISNTESWVNTKTKAY